MVSPSSSDISFENGGQAFSQQFQDYYFSLAGPREESRYVFLEGNQIEKYWAHQEEFTILELGLGSGMNFIETAHLFLESKAPPKKLQYIAIEKFPLKIEDLKKILDMNYTSNESQDFLQCYPQILKGETTHPYASNISLKIYHCDVLTALQKIKIQFDTAYLDGFSPKKNPDMWSPAVFSCLANLAKPNARLASYCAASQVQRDLKTSGFIVKKRKGFGKKREMIYAETETKTSRGQSSNKNRT